ncbi:ionotropic receptor 93a-like [Scylla paramamosain]|uniref:ionotropic receptor 93a-like n=1 Tax=Scylla paramamosain TaxID=85552 RepID=UPI003082D7F7
MIGRRKLIRLDGLLGTLIDKIRRNLNFDIEFMSVQGFGVKTDNGSYNGVLGMVQRREADFTAASLSLLAERAKAVDFGEWFGFHNTRFLTRVSKLLEGNFLLFQIFTWQAWASIMTFLIVSAASLSAMWMREENTTTTSNTGQIFPAVFISVTTILKTAVNMSSSHLPRHSAGRLVLISSWVVVVVLVAVYRGNLTAFLSIPMVASPPTTIQELLDMGYTLSVSRGYSQYHKMKTSPIMHHLEAFKRAELRQDQGILPKEEYITRLQTQPLALLDISILGDFSVHHQLWFSSPFTDHPGELSINFAILHDLEQLRQPSTVTVMAVPLVMDKYAETRGAERVCTLQMSSEKLFLEIGGLAFPKNSPIKYLFDQHLRDNTSLRP